MPVAFEEIPFLPGQSFRLLQWSDNVREVELCLSHGKTQRLEGVGEAWHFHPEIELTLVTSGRGRRFVGDHVSALDAMDLVLIGSNLPHYWSGLTGSSGYSLQFVHDHTHPIWELHETNVLLAVQEIASRGVKIDGPAVAQIHQLMQKIAKADPVSGLIHFLEILATINQLSVQQATPLSGKRFSLVDRDPHMQAISSAVQYVLSNFQDHITLDNLLELTHMSKPTFSRQFKRHTGRTLMAFVNQVRIDFARQQLSETIDPITDVAFNSGYTNLSHFNRQFKRICGCAPRDYREQRRGTVEQPESKV